jgi:hypothetical protein
LDVHWQAPFENPKVIPMLDTIAAMPISIILTSGLAYLVLIFLIVFCVFAISINENRLQELRLIEQTLQRNSEKIASLGSLANPDVGRTNPTLANDFRKLLDEANVLSRKVFDINYKRFYGDQKVRDKLLDKRKKAEWRWADRFHSNSDTMNLMIIGMCACSIALCAGRLVAAMRIRNQHQPTLIEIFSSVTLFDVLLGLLTGLLVTFVLKSGSNILSKTTLSTVDASNPYGVAFVTAIAGLFIDKFFSWLEQLFTIAK